MNIQQRVKFALIGFNGLFANATEYSFDNVVNSAVQIALESEGMTSEPSDSGLKEIVVAKACYEALAPIESIILQMPKRKRIEVGIETENANVQKNLANLKQSYLDRYNSLQNDGADVQTFSIRNAIEETEDVVVTLETLPGIGYDIS